MSLPRLLILPGLLEDADAFEQVIAGLSGIVEVSIADMTRADTIAGLASGALERAPEGDLLLAGHSMGGYAALEAVRQAPRRIRKLALLNTNARPDTPEATANRRKLLALADKDFPAVSNTLLPKLMAPAHLGDPVLTGMIGAMALAIGPEAFKRQQQAIIARIDSRPHLARIGVPTLVVAGRHDALMPVEILEEMAGGIPGARLAVIEEAGHMASIEEPRQVLALLKEWIAA